MRTKIIDKVALICIKDRRVLTTLSKNKTKLYFPGGKREGTESDLECLAREVREELNVTLIESSATFLGVFDAQADGHDSGIVVIMRCYFADYDGTPQASNEIESFEWISYRDKIRTSAVDHLIMDQLKEMNLIN